MNLPLSFLGFMADLPIPCLVLNLLLMRGMVESPRHSHMLYIYLHVVETFRDWKGTSAWKCMDLEHWIAHAQNWPCSYSLIWRGLRGKDKLTYQAANYLSSLGQKHLVDHSREESNVHVARSEVTSSPALTLSLISKTVIIFWYLPCIWEVTHSCRHRKGRSLGLSREVLRRVLETCLDMFQKLQQCTSKWLQ